MKVGAVAGAVGVAGVVLAWLSLSIGIWPSASLPAAQRADVRELLAARAGRDVDVGAPAAPGPARGQLRAWSMCHAPRAGDTTLLAPPAGGAPRVWFACGEGAELWSIDDAGPRRLLRVEVPGEGLALGPALGIDMDVDGQWDLLFALHATADGSRHRQGLYWVRGRSAGGFEEPVRLLPAAVDALLEPEGDAGALWVAVHEPPPASRGLLWQVARGAAPQRGAQWELPAPARALVRAGAGKGWGLAGGGVWPLPDDRQARVAPVLEAHGVASLTSAGGELLARTDAGLRRLQVGDGQAVPAWGPASGPARPTSVALLGDGTRLAVAEGALWAWREGREPAAFEAAGGARVETLLARDGRVWVWLSGLAGAQAAGLLPLPAPWPPAGPVELVVRAAEGEPSSPRVRVP